MTPFLQPTLQNERIYARPLQYEDFDALYAVASDPFIWEQHPNKDRYKRDVFENYFRGAMESGGAFLICDAATRQVIGSSRYCNWNAETRTIEIGYTFIARDHWGTTYNRALKTLMLDHAFTFAEAIQFFIGAVNVRSQNAITKLGAQKIAERETAYYGESKKLDFVYEITKSTWFAIRDSKQL
ncbi:MAG TPA: GNAT family N-acetyltransferase [bacterium]|nr:GNAT family N-acetyltransferase [bacterium]HMZ05874.1 GNAT family N-acetyltransferase [bacterium]HNH30235.1 GNAT family N-acetyltransferase [bacterium]HNH34131.1 GNAT family N-acetyltransferase [bacterium]HNI11749.1 GNAT family N-acetyltransferase [bacterium]